MSFEREISEHIFAPHGGFCVHYPSNTFRNNAVLKIGEFNSDIPQIYLGNVQSREAFRSIALGRKDLMDYKVSFCCINLQGVTIR